VQYYDVITEGRWAISFAQHAGDLFVNSVGQIRTWVTDIVGGVNVK
ncbi:2042_t:CDS:1, partial [Entrophospora sp. SA101]